MSARSVIVRLEAEVAGYIAGMGKAGQATENVARQVVQARKATDENRQAMESAGRTMVVFGASSVAALGASAKAAMDWESAWAGVTKTVDGSPEQMAELESGLRNLAKTLPLAHTEIAGVAEAAGQLGVKREDILAFTKTMIDLGETTNLTAEEAATDIAQIANVMGTTGGEIDNFGAALVALGNDGASTEKEILSMAQRIAGAGKLVGATEADVLALSNTLASMGVRAELGGGVATRVLLKMFEAVQDGGGKLDAFAKMAGTSSEEFAKAFREKPIEALGMVTKGMARTSEEGGNVVAMMKDMGIKGTEEMQVMLSLAGAGDLLADSLKLGAQAWEENTALLEEATKRYATTESKVKVAWNNIKDAAIDAGAVLLPVIQGVAESVSGLASSFGDLPAPVQGAITTLGGVVGVAALLGGGMLTLLPKINDTRTAFRDLDASGSRIPGVLGRIGKAAGAATAAIIGFEVIKGIHNSIQPGTKSVEEFTQALVGLKDNGSAVNDTFRGMDLGQGVERVDSAGAALSKLINQDFGSSVASFGSTVLGIDNHMTKLADAVDKVDQSIAGAATSGNLDLAAKGFKSVADSAQAQGVEVSKTAERFPLYINALREMASQGGVTLTEQELLNWAMGETPAKMEAAAAGGDKAAAAITGTGAAAEAAAAQTKEISDALDEVGLSASGAVTDIGKFTAALFAAGLLSLSASDASIAYQAAIDSLTESVTKNGKSLDITTEQGRANQSAYNGLAQAAMTAMTATAEETLATQGSAAAQEQLQAGLQQSYSDLIRAAGQFGITGDAADTMARKALGIPKEVPIKTWVNDKASSELDRIKGKADALDGRTIRTYSIHRETTIYETEGSASVSVPLGTADKRAAAHADGGAIRGPGTSTSDEVPIWASDGEHMLDKGDVIKMGGQQAVYKFRQDLKAGNVPGLAGGGAVGTTVAARTIMTHTAPAQPISLDGLQLVGQMELNSDATWATFRGVARQEAAGVVAGADSQSQYTRAGRK